MIRNRSKLSPQKSARNLKLECVKFLHPHICCISACVKKQTSILRGSRSRFNPNEEASGDCHGRRRRAGCKLNQPISKCDPESCSGFGSRPVAHLQRWAAHAEQEKPEVPSMSGKVSHTLHLAPGCSRSGAVTLLGWVEVSLEQTEQSFVSRPEPEKELGRPGMF